MQTTLLKIISRLSCSDRQYKAIVDECYSISNWDIVLDEAEYHGLTPLLRRHLRACNAAIPSQVMRQLQFLQMRHTHTNLVLLSWLKKAMRALEEAGIPTLVLKGAALCQILYDDIGLRPMRDLDILLRKDDLPICFKILSDFGFKPSGKAVPENHFHLQPLYLQSEGVKVCFELHHSLYPTCPPFCINPPFEYLYSRALSVPSNKLEIKTLHHGDMLIHLFQHGLKTPLTYEPIKLIHICDIISYIEKYHQFLDWSELKTNSQQVFNGLPYLDYITKFQCDIRQFFPKPLKVSKSQCTPFNGWPHKRFADLKHISRRQIVFKTFWPSKWWVLTYYGIVKRWDYFLHRFIHHPAHVWWWIQIYWNLFVEEQTNKTSDSASKSKKYFRTLRNGRLILIKIYNKNLNRHC